MMHTGIVKSFSADDGYGFLIITAGLKAELRLDLNRDLFVHAKQVQRPFNGGPELNRGDHVEFEIGQTNKGPCAINVRVLRSGRHNTLSD